ncbi:MAG: hypothetical protein EXR92_03115 [Gemmatimonadetes bacterium]|nr:hypothetical protein [Gemmatimonadota bacterium]
MDNQILKFTRDGKFLLQIGHAGTGVNNLSTENVAGAADLYVHDETNEVFVADGYGNRRVIVFDATTGAFKRMWGAYGNPPIDQADDEEPYDPRFFGLPHGIRISNDGLVYVSDAQGMRIQVFTVSGEYLFEKMMGRYPDVNPAAMAARANDMSFGAPSTDLITATAEFHRSVSRTAFSPDAAQKWMFVLERSNHEVVVIERATFKELYRFGTWGDEIGEFYVLHDMTADNAGDIYTVEVNDIGGTRKRTQKWVLSAGTAPTQTAVPVVFGSTIFSGPTN